MDRAEQEDEQRLREVMCERRSVGICCHDPPHGEASCPHLRPFHTVSLQSRLNKGKKEGRSPRGSRTPEPYETALWMLKRTRSPSYAPGSDQPLTPKVPPPAKARPRKSG